MAIEGISVRDRKSAKLKLLVLSIAKNMLREQTFQNIHVMDICNKAGISKVTFFRYFPQKEDLLLYFMRVWAFELSLELQKNEIKGIKAVKLIFDRYADLCDHYHSAILHLIKYHAVSPLALKPISIKKAEKQLLFPQEEEIQQLEVLSFDKLLEKHMLEAIFQTEVTKSSDVTEMVSMLLTSTYGSILVAKMKQLPVKSLLKKNIHAVLQTF